MACVWLCVCHKPVLYWNDCTVWAVPNSGLGKITECPSLCTVLWVWSSHSTFEIANVVNNRRMTCLSHLASSFVHTVGGWASLKLVSVSLGEKLLLGYSNHPQWLPFCYIVVCCFVDISMLCYCCVCTCVGCILI